MTRPVRTVCLTVAAVLAAASAVGCGSKSTTPDRPRPDGKYEVAEFESMPAISADTHYAAGQLAESKIGRGPNMSPPGTPEAQMYEDAALRQYARVLDIDPAHVPTLFRAATIQTRRKVWAEALPLWERHAEATGRSENAVFNLAVATELSGSPRKARPMYEEVVSMNPLHHGARTNLGVMLAREGQLKEGAEHLSTVHTPAGVHWHLGIAAHARGDARAADRHFRAAGSLDPAYRHQPRPDAATARVE